MPPYRFYMNKQILPNCSTEQTVSGLQDGTGDVEEKIEYDMLLYAVHKTEIIPKMNYRVGRLHTGL